MHLLGLLRSPGSLWVFRTTTTSVSGVLFCPRVLQSCLAKDLPCGSSVTSQLLMRR